MQYLRVDDKGRVLAGGDRLGAELHWQAGANGDCLAQVAVTQGHSEYQYPEKTRARPFTGRDLITSTVHNPRTLAATYDSDTHDPTAATPAGGP